MFYVLGEAKTPFVMTLLFLAREDAWHDYVDAVDESDNEDACLHCFEGLCKAVARLDLSRWKYYGIPGIETHQEEL